MVSFFCFFFDRVPDTRFLYTVFGGRKWNFTVFEMPRYGLVYSWWCNVFATTFCRSATKLPNLPRLWQYFRHPIWAVGMGNVIFDRFS